MKFCYGCGRTTGGKPLFCNFCGRSYERKVCPGLHLNPRWAEACSRCGNRNLSTPQPRVPLAWRLVAVAVLVGAAVVSLYIVILARARAVIAVVLFGLWSSSPHMTRIAIYRLLKRRHRRRLD